MLNLRLRSGRVRHSQPDQHPTTHPTKSCRLPPMVRFRASIGRVMVRNPTTNPTSKNRLFMRKTRLMVGLVRFLIRGEKKTAARIHARTGSGAGYERRGNGRRAGAPGHEATRR